MYRELLMEFVFASTQAEQDEANRKIQALDLGANNCFK